MEITRKTDYALRMVAELIRSESGVMSVRSAAQRNDVPYSFARSIQHDLVRAGIVESLCGSHGGMRLAVDPSATSLLRVVEAVQGSVCFSGCDTAGEGEAPCPRMGDCPYNPVWCGATRLLRDYLASVTLLDVVTGSRAPSLPARYAQPGAFDGLRGAIAESLEA